VALVESTLASSCVYYVVEEFRLFPPPTSIFLGSILCYSQSGNHPQEDLAKFLLQAEYESNLKKTSFLCILATYSKPLFINLATFSSILVEEWLLIKKKENDFSTLNFYYIILATYIASKKIDCCPPFYMLIIKKSSKIFVVFPMVPHCC
jgi:hypothetical protein